MSESRYLAAFCLCIAVYILAATVLVVRSEQNLIDVKVDFSRMRDSERLSLNMLTRQQVGVLKVAHLKTTGRPQLAVFGNHQLQYFSKDALGNDSETSFFNLWFANLALPELYEYVKYVASIDRLPTKLAILQITTPNNDCGNNIITWNNELPRFMVRHNNAAHKFTLSEKTKIVVDEFLGTVARSLNASMVMTSFRNFLSDDPEFVLADRIVESAGCTAGTPCARKLERSFRNDGSFDPKFSNKKRLVLNGDSNTKEMHISLRDAERIAEYMTRINDVFVENKVSCVFVIPPVYETKRATVVDEAFDRALHLLKDVPVIDHRHGFTNPEFFEAYDHPSGVYFSFLIEQLKHKLYL